MIDDLAGMRRGTAVFFHLLVPHDPFVLDARCNMREGEGRSDLAGWWDGYGDGMINDEESRRSRYGRYFEQVVCVFNRMTVMLERLEQAGRLDGATVVIHGDYGSRISLAHKDGDPGNLSERDLIDLHATYFAIRSASVAVEAGDELVTLQRLFARLFAAGPGSAEAGTGNDPVVILKPIPNSDALDVQSAERPMPVFRAELSASPQRSMPKRRLSVP